MMTELNAEDPKAARRMAEAFGPGQVDALIGQAIQMCWMMLPDDKKSVDNLERELRRILDRALVNLRDDAKAFGIGNLPPDHRATGE